MKEAATIWKRGSIYFPIHVKDKDQRPTTVQWNHPNQVWYDLFQKIMALVLNLVRSLLVDNVLHSIHSSLDPLSISIKRTNEPMSVAITFEEPTNKVMWSCRPRKSWKGSLATCNINNYTENICCQWVNLRVCLQCCIHCTVDVCMCNDLAQWCADVRQS